MTVVGRLAAKEPNNPEWRPAARSPMDTTKQDLSSWRVGMCLLSLSFSLSYYTVKCKLVTEYRNVSMENVKDSSQEQLRRIEIYHQHQSDQSCHKSQQLQLYSHVVVFVCCCHMVQLKSSLFQQNRRSCGGLQCFKYGCYRLYNWDASQSIPLAQCHQFDQIWSQPPLQFLHYCIAGINLKAPTPIKGK